MDTLVRTVSLNGFLDVCSLHGLNSHALLRQVGMDAGALVDSERHISAETLCKLLGLAAQESGNSAFGIQMAQHRQTLDFGILGVLMRHQSNLREIWHAAMQYRKLLNDATVISLETSGELSILRFELLINSQTPQQQACELLAGVIMRTCQAVLGSAWSPREVRFMHAAPLEQYQHKQFFGCPITFSSDFNGLVLRTNDMTVPNPAADAELVRYAESMVMPMRALGESALLQEVRRNIYLLMPLEQACIEQVAEQMHVSMRTLQRQLDQHGTSFSQVLDTVRKNLVMRYMNNRSYSIGQVASLTGYSRQASFTRWFHAHFGTSPRQWRQMHVEHAHPAPFPG